MCLKFKTRDKWFSLPVGRSGFGIWWQPVVWASLLFQGRARAWPCWLMQRCNCLSLFWTQMPVSILGFVTVGSDATPYFCASDKSRQYSHWGCLLLLPKVRTLLISIYNSNKKPNMRTCSMPYIRDFFYSIFFHLGRTLSPRKLTQSLTVPSCPAVIAHKSN